MKTATRSNIRYYLKWVLWVVIVQFILVNISASVYAYKFTHFYNTPPVKVAAQNIFERTWKLFTGPSFYKNTIEPSPSFPYETVHLKTSDDIPIDGWYSPSDTSSKCVILFHGITVNKSYVADEASMFRSWGYNVLLIDFRGHGKSGGSTSSFGVKETDEVKTAFSFAQAKGNKKILLYGVSMGAAVCIRAVHLNLVKPDAIIADMPFGTLRNHLRSRAALLGFPSEPFATLVTFWIGVERGYNGFKHDISSYAKDVKCPVLVEWGEEDPYVKQEEIYRVFNNLSSVNKKIVTYFSAGHESFLKNDPSRWIKEVQSFTDEYAE